MLPGVPGHTFNFGGCNVAGIDTAHTATLSMHLQHDPGCSLTIQGKKHLQYLNHKFHGRKIVIQQYDIEKRRWFRPGTLFFKNGVCRISGCHV